MSRDKIIPTEPSPAAQKAGIPLGNFDGDTNSYEVELQAPRDEGNLLRTVHGGWVSMLCDEAAAMVAYFLYGVNSAFTEELNISFQNMLRPGLPIRCHARLIHTLEDFLYIDISVYSGDKVIASASSKWKLRQ